jgi:hypothetical protein
MGTKPMDRFSFLHVATGIVSYYLGISLKWWTILNIAYEIIDNTNCFMYIVNNYIPNIWPGGKPGPDTIINSMGDILSSIFGWYIAYMINKGET